MLAFALAGCFPTGAQAWMQTQPQAIPPALTMDQVSALYDTAFATSATLIREKGLGPAPVYDLRTMDLGPCRHHLPDGGGTPLDDAIVKLAFEMAYFRHSLRAGLFRTAEYEPILVAFETRAVNALYQRSRNRADTVQYPDIRGLVARLELVRAQRDPGRPGLTYVATCAYRTNFPVVVRAVPEDGRVWFISRFNFRLCEALGKNPWSRPQCSLWRESDNGISNPLFGEIVYQARWPDGREGKGDRTIQQARREGAKLVIRVKPDF